LVLQQVPCEAGGADVPRCTEMDPHNLPIRKSHDPGALGHSWREAAFIMRYRMT
jgi:hypothetical protein